MMQRTLWATCLAAALALVFSVGACGKAKDDGTKKGVDACCELADGCISVKNGTDGETECKEKGGKAFADRHCEAQKCVPN